MVEKIIHTSVLIMNRCSCYSMWQRYQAVSISMSGGTVRTEFQSLKGKPNTHAWSTVESLPSNLWPLIPGCGSGPLSPSTGPFSCHPWCSATSSILSILFILSLRHSGRYVHLPGRSVTRLTAYHIYGMWLVLSNA